MAAPRLLAPGGALRLLVEWRPDHGGAARLFASGSVCWLRSAGGWTLIEPQAPRITPPPGAEAAALEELVWTIPAAVCLLHRDDLVLHGAAVEVEGQALLLAAGGRAGKSTLAAAFARVGFRVLSDDVSCLRVDGRPAVIPGPSLLRLRPDVAPHLAIPGSRLLRRAGGRITLTLDPRGTCDPVPLRAVALLQAGEGLSLERLPAAEAIRRLWPLAFRRPSARSRAGCFARLARLAASVPAFIFSRPVRLEALAAAVRRLAG